MFYTGFPPVLGAPARLGARVRLLPPLPGLVFPPIARGGGPVYGALNPFQFGAAVVDPGSVFFRAGNPLGGPSESFRGVSASPFPQSAVVLGPGAPLSAELLGLAGAPIGPASGIGGAAFTL